MRIENIFKYFSRSNVKIIIFEEWTKNIRTVMTDLCAFLGIPDRDSWPQLPENAQHKTDRYRKDEKLSVAEMDVKIDPELQAQICNELSMVYEYVEKLMERKMPW